MSESSQLVFYGEILPGHDADQVKGRLAELLKLPPDQIAGVFSGRRVVLRRSLPGDQAASYVARLEKIGVKVFVEAAPPVMAPVTAPDTPVTTQPAAAPSALQTPPSPQIAAPDIPALAVVDIPPVEEMACPKCGERQPRRTLCRACSVDMKRYADSQALAEREAKEARAFEREVALAGRSLGSQGMAAGEESVGILGLGFSGRLGRLSYLAGNLLYWTVIAFAIVILIRTGTVFIAAACVLIATIASLRLSVLRCHDIGWSGWLTLIFFVPYIGPLFGLVLMFMPGMKDDNNHGAPSPAPGFPMGFAILVLFALSMGALYKQQDAFLAYAMNRTMGGSTGMASSGQTGGGPVHSLADADVEMFTTSSCGVCHMAKAYMHKHGITYVEKDVEKNEEYLRDFYARGGRGVPYIFVGRQSMEGFDPERLQDMLASRG